MNIYQYPENKDELPKYRIAVMQAALEGKPVQHSTIFDGYGEWRDFGPGYAPVWDWSGCRYRIKPEPQLKPWTAETFRWPDCLRQRNQGLGPSLPFAVLEVCELFVRTANGAPFGNTNYTWDGLLDCCEASYDRGATWVRCGEEVTS